MKKNLSGLAYFFAVIVFMQLGCRGHDTTEHSDTSINLQASGSRKIDMDSMIVPMDEPDDTPTIQEERVAVAKTYDVVRSLDSTVNIDSETLRFQLKYSHRKAAEHKFILSVPYL